MIALVMKLMRPRDREEFYTFADAVGNLRLDRFSFAYGENPKQRAESRIFVHSPAWETINGWLIIPVSP